MTLRGDVRTTLSHTPGQCTSIVLYARCTNICCSTVDYNSWVESDKGRKLTSTLDKDVVLAEGKSLPPCM